MFSAVGSATQPPRALQIRGMIAEAIMANIAASVTANAGTAISRHGQHGQGSIARLGDEVGLLVEEGHAELQENGVDVALALGDQGIELSLPAVVLIADAEGDPVGHARPA